MLGMVFGHNTNVKLGALTFHVQTEDRGETHALLDTTVYYQGCVLHRRTNNYFDLLPLDDDRLQALKLRLDEQHRTVLEEIRSGALHLTPPAIASKPPAAPEAEHPSPASVPPAKLALELANPRDWFNGKHASLHILVRDADGQPVSGAQVVVSLDGSAEEHSFTAVSAADGKASVEFDMPKLTGADAALVIRADHSGAHGALRFTLRARPRVPSV